MFVDVAQIKIKSGRGGDGRVSFHREKYIAAGGPDGGDGGEGGDIVFVTDGHMSTLLDFRYHRKYAAEDGQPGSSKRCFGKDGADLVIKVPYGTLIKDAETGALLQDMSTDRPFVAAKGGRGGWGNAHFATPTRQAPRFAKPGLNGMERSLILELKLIADVGLIGMPNAGKSTLLSAISAARPKIADYPFTTLSPNLGVVPVGEGSSFVAADIPGIIEGAAEGAGLGHDFLRHIDRCRLLIHVVDVSGSEGRDPAEDFEIINRELASYNPQLAMRPQIVAANKCDVLPPDSDHLSHLKKQAETMGFPVFGISAVTGAGVSELIQKVWLTLSGLPPVAVYAPEEKIEFEEAPEVRDIKIEKIGDVYQVSGRWPERIVASVNFDDYESRMYFHKVLQNAGVFDILEKEGVKQGDTVRVCDIEFEYVY